MALFVTTKQDSFSIKDGYCNAVYDSDDKRVLGDGSLDGCKVLGLVRADDVLASELIPLEIAMQSAGPYRLVFGEKGSRVITEIVTSFRNEPDRLVSIPPPSLRKSGPMGKVPAEMLEFLFGSPISSER